MKYIITLLLLAVSWHLCFAESGFGVSAAFTIDTADPIVTITSPILGQECLAGFLLPINWATEESHIPPDCISLNWRLNPASAWNLIANNEVNDGYYNWLVVADETDNAQIKVTMSDAFGNMGFAVSEPFIILPTEEPQPVTITSTPSWANVYIDGAYQGVTPYTTSINPNSSFVVTVQKPNYAFIPTSQTVNWIDEPQSFHFTGSFTGTGTVVDPNNIPDVWVTGNSPYNISEPIVIPANQNITMQEGVEVINYTISAIPVHGSVNATNVTFSSILDTLYWGGLEIVGNDARLVSNFNGCLILNASTPFNIINSSPIIDSLQIALADSTATMSNVAIQISGTSAPDLNNVVISNYETGVEIIANELPDRDSPTLTNVRIRNTSSTLRQGRFPVDYEPQGIKITGYSNASFSDIVIENYLTGISIQNDSLLTAASPTLTNVRIRNTSSTLRAPSNGIVMNGYQNASLNNVQIDYYNQGVVIDNINPTFGASPTLTNVRIRNTSSTLREESFGILVSNNVSPVIRDCKISYAETGVMDISSANLDMQNSTITNCNKGFSGFLPNNPVLKKNLFLAEQSWVDSQAVNTVVAVDIVMGTSLTVRNNTFYGYPKLMKLNTVTCVFENNIAWKSSLFTAPFQLINSSLIVRYNNIRANASAYPGTGAVGNLNTDPLFINEAERNFHLHFNSPCIDTGNPTSLTDTDGTRADMGAYAYLHKADFILPQTAILSGIPFSFINTSLGHDDPSTLVQWDLGGNGSTDATGRNWTVAFPTAGTYSLKLTMITGNLTDHSPLYQFTVINGSTLTAPANVLASVSMGQLSISWDMVPGAQSYKIMASDVPYGTFTEINSGEGSFSTQANRVTWTTNVTTYAKRFYKIIATTVQ